MIIQPPKDRETAHVWLAVAITLALAAYRISAYVAGPLHDILQAYTSLPVSTWLSHFLFLWLLVLLWMAYHRWRDALVRRRELQNVLASISPDALLVASPEREILACNPSVEHMFGYRSEEIVGRRTDMLYSDRRSKPEARELYAHLDQHGFHIGQATGVRKDGSTFPVEIITGTLRVGSGVVLLLRDIAERFEAERSLRESEKRYRLLVENAPVGVICIDRAGNITEINTSLVNMIGAPSAEEARRVNVLSSPALMSSGIAAKARECIETGQSCRFERWYTSSWDKQVCLELYMVPTRDATGKIMGLQGIVADVTQRHRLEAQFLQSQKMEATGRLAGGVAHDFNNLLTAINGYADIGQATLDKGDPVHKYLGEIRKAGERAANLTRQLLAFSRRQRARPRVIDLNAVILEMDKMVRRLIGADIELVFLPGAGLGTVRADPGQLEQVIVNLIVNARDAMPEGGKIVIETSNAEVEEPLNSVDEKIEAGRYVLLSISDTGAGMSEEVQSHMFEPFFSTKKSNKGTGLGLSTVYGIVKQSEGYIRVESSEAKGSTFTIYMPGCSAPAETSVVRPEEGYSPKGDETILLVEDEPSVRRFVAKTLEDAGYTVLTAPNGNEAIRIAREADGTLDLLLTDIVMPKMGGYELARRLTGERDGLRVLYTSGYDDEDMIREEVAAANSGFLEKPFTGKALLKKVRNLLDREL